MMHFVDDILQILDSENINCDYMKGEQVVHGLYKNGKAEIRCFFLCGFPEKVMSYSICSNPVPIKRLDEVELNLLKINTKLHTGYFYFDKDTHCITYYNEYQMYPSQLASNEGLKRFCRWSYEVFQLYDKTLYTVNND